MTKLQNTIKKAALALMVSTVWFTQTSFAADVEAYNINEVQARIEALSYAPQSAPSDEMFSQFDFENNENEYEYAEHELNDGWLGMPAYSSDNKLIGYIDDAFLDDDGYVTQIVVGLNGTQKIVEIDAQHAGLYDEKVQFSLSDVEIAALSDNNELASLKP